MLTGASLDEQCLLNLVQSEGIARFIARSQDTITIKVGAEFNNYCAAEVYEILAINEFTSERKLMSVAVREKATGKCLVFAKGAESSIMNCLAPESE